MSSHVARAVEQCSNLIADMRKYNEQVARFTERVLEASVRHTPVYVQYIPQNTETEVYQWLMRV